MIISKVITNSKIIAVHFSRQKELDAHPKAIYQIEFIGHLKIQVMKMLLMNPRLS